MRTKRLGRVKPSATGRPLSTIVDRFITELLYNGNLNTKTEKSKIMWAILDSQGEIIAIKPLRRLAVCAAAQKQTIRRVRVILEE